MDTASTEWVVIYRGRGVAGLDLIEAMLTAEGFEPRRLGRATPALFGAGESAVEQLIAVRADRADAARELLAASQYASDDPEDVADLETQALLAGPAPELGPSFRAAPNLLTFTTIMVALVLAYLWLRT